jgi:GTP cyclohydrolase I
MTLSIRPDTNSADQMLPSLSTQQLPTVTEAEMMQAVRTFNYWSRSCCLHSKS